MPGMQTTYTPSSATTATGNAGRGGDDISGLIEQLISRKLQKQLDPRSPGVTLGHGSTGRTREELMQERAMKSQLSDASQARDLRERMFMDEQEKARAAEAQRQKLMKPRDWSPLTGMHSTWQDILSTNNPDEYKTYQAAALAGLK